MSISASADSKREIIFIHGYTGGPTDFADLPGIMGREFSADVHCPLLPGHGTAIDDLINLSCDDLFGGIEKRIVDALHAGKTVLLAGVSLGAQAALYFAAKYPVAGVIAIAATHGLRFPFNMPGIGHVALLSPTWAKRSVPHQLGDGATVVRYDEVPSNGLFLSRDLRSRVEAGAPNIRAPVLFVHSTKERFSDPRAVEKLRAGMAGKTELWLLHNAQHVLFFSDARQEVIQEIISFVRRSDVFATHDPSPIRARKVSAIVPCYNESAHVEVVLRTLKSTPMIDEIIVVDDGSTDDTSIRIGSMDSVRLLRNERNLGKAGSLERGVRAASFDIVFFCDADLVDFRPEHVEAIVRPVVDGQYDMFIGVRGNILQTMVRAWALNSGERALRKEIWFSLPMYYKHRYRVEAGLNYYVRNYTSKGLGWRVFDYSQLLKETKYGFPRGTLLRWWMYFDVASAYLSYRIIYRHLRRKSTKA